MPAPMRWRGGGRCGGRRVSDIAACLGLILPPGVSLGQADAPQALWPREDLPAAVPSRLVEFATGRAAARQALEALGYAPVAIPIGPDRAPQWPDAITGSISHCAGACLAAAGFSRDYLGLGLDVEPASALPEDVWETVLRPEERGELAAFPRSQQGLQALRIFVAKEAAYKAQYPISRQLFDFHTLRIIWQDQGFSAAYQQAIRPFEKNFQLAGRVAENLDHVAAICWLPTA